MIHPALGRRCNVRCNRHSRHTSRADVGITSGTAVYRGVPLKKVLKRACGGVLPECKHLEFVGADTYFKCVLSITLLSKIDLDSRLPVYRKGHVFNYAVSVPYRKVRANEEVLLAWEMNGKPLPKIHGFPLRAVVTGYIGARSTKWLYKINAIAEPSLAPVQAQEYLYFTQQVRPFERFSVQDAIERAAVARSASRTPSTPMGSLSRTCLSRM